MQGQTKLDVRNSLQRKPTMCKIFHDTIFQITYEKKRREKLQFVLKPSDCQGFFYRPQSQCMTLTASANLQQLISIYLKKKEEK